MKSMDDLVEIIKKLRAPDGCPWDRVQTHKSIRGHLVEECAELLEAIDLDSPAKMREEIGDILMHLALHAEIASENGDFTLDDAVRELNAKLIRRHPHVFGSLHAENSDDVLKIWQNVKKEEKKERAVGKLFDGIPPQLSAMRYAYDIAKKAPKPLLDKVAESTKDNADQNFGRKMFELIREASAAKIEPEAALRDYISAIRDASENEAAQ